MNEVQVLDGDGRLAGGHALRDAVLSECGTYRYLLTRRIPQIVRHVKPALFVMLNPSTANDVLDDPTIRRCIGFAKDWLCTSLTVVNLFALRSTDPKALRSHPDPIGPENPRYVSEQLSLHLNTGVIVCAWGAEPSNLGLTEEPWMIDMVKHLIASNAMCLGTTKNGSPKHPLYLKKDQELIPWQGYLS